MFKWFISILFILSSSCLLANSHRPEIFLNEIKGRSDEGKRIVRHFCANCHATKPLIELGAPKINNEIDWKNRLINQNLEGLLENTKEGLNAMPARGGCFECSDEQLKAAIIDMLPLKFQKKHKEHK